jgi:acyl transferase domain-containing protein/acyl carrier protein
MSGDSERLGNLSPLKRALIAIDELQARLDAAERARTEPIAIVGMSCRFPGGADDPAAYWRLLRDGVDAIREIPPERWDVDAYYDPDPSVPGKMYVRKGGFLREVDRFDPAFFGISPREATGMDPQQRLLLEVAWEALESAGQAPDRLSGTQTGVFIGMMNTDYENIGAGDATRIDPYFVTGNAHSIAAGRLSYLLGLQGPSLAVDTACSSSLVALHLACQSLRNGESNLALVGGVNLMLGPEATIASCKLRALAPDGHCKTFDARADGYTRGEGCGIVVLKRLSEALADGDEVLAIIRGSAVNQDGRSNGLTAPSALAQEAVLRTALANAGVEPGEVGYVEAHGTGTSLGDPIEVRALGAVLGQGRKAEEPLVLGSAKTNVGHLEAAAGMAGLIKVVLSLRNGEIPPHLHFQQLNPHISLKEIPAEIATELRPWAAGKRRIAGVSAFGFSGTNAHVILEEAPAREAATAAGRPWHLLNLSATSEAGLKALARRFEGYLSAAPAAALEDICYTAQMGRSHFAHRLSVVADSAEHAAEQLAAFLAGAEGTGTAHGQVKGQSRPKVAFLFTGAGSQYPGMGRELYDTEPVFRAALDRCAELARPLLQQPLLSVLYPEPGVASPLDDIAYTQPAMFALEYALCELWRSWGIHPDWVMGHSVGELTVACVAGVFTLEDGLRLVIERGRLMRELSREGEMVAINAEEARVAEALAPHVGEASIAAINGPEDVVIAGTRGAVRAVAGHFEAQGVKTKRLAISIASHSPMMDPMLDAFERVAASITYAPPRLGLVSNVTGRRVEGREVSSASYWRRHVREPVRFADGLKTLHAQGVELFVEVGPHPTLLGMGARCLPKDAGVWLPSLRKGQPDGQQMLASLGGLYTRGVEADWRAVYGGQPRRKVMLPTVAWQRERYWVESPAPASPAASVERRPSGAPVHPLLGHRVQHSPLIKEALFESRLGLGTLPWLEDHRVHGAALLPAAAYLEAALAAANEVLPGVDTVEELVMREPLVLPDEGTRVCQLVVSPEGAAGATFQLISLGEGSAYTAHASGRFRATRATDARPTPPSLAEARASCSETLSTQDFHAQFAARGLELGPRFQGIQKLWRGRGEALGELRLPEALSSEAGAYRIHPALLDACFQLVAAALTGDAARGAAEDVFLLMKVDRCRIPGRPGAALWSHAVLRPGGDGELTADVRLYGADGTLAAEFEGLHLRRVSPEALRPVGQRGVDDLFYELRWLPRSYLDRAAPRSPPGFLPALPEVASRLRAIEGPRDVDSLSRLLRRVDGLSAAYVVRALRQLGAALKPGQRLSRTELAESLGVVPRYHRLLERMLGMLAEEGALAPAGDGWEVRTEPVVEDAQALAENLRAQSPEAAAVLELLAGCGPSLAEVMRGTRDPLPLLFPEGSTERVEAVYRDSPFAQAWNARVREALAEAVARLPAGRPLRVLEIGAGTGGTTTHVLPVLPVDRTEYVFTDVSSRFTVQAAERFRDFPFLRYQVLDIEQEPTAQGFAPHGFDVVIAANVLHATADLRVTLRHARRLLAPGGMLVLLEVARPTRWADLTFGLTEGWWRFTDTELRPAHPLLSPARWRAVLGECGFSEAVALPEEAPAHDPQALVLARASSETEQSPAAVTPTKAEPGAWLILTDAGGAGARLAERLRARGDECVLVGDIDPARPEDFAQRLKEALGTGGKRWRGIVHLWALDAEQPEKTSVESLHAELLRGTGGLLHLVQALQAEGMPPAPRLVLVTRAAQAVRPGDAVSVSGAPLWGLARVLGHEHPELRCTRVDLGGQDEARELDALVAELEREDAEVEVALRGEDRYAPRLLRATVGGPRQPVAFREDATYLITGGLGGIGLTTAQWMVRHGARSLVLMGRSGASPEAERTLESLRQLGARITVARADVTQAEQVAAVLEDIQRTLPPLRGVLHTAAVLDDATLRRLDWSRFRTVLGPKVDGAWHLHTLTRALPLDFFVLFSSATALLGSPGVGNYMAANAFLDGLAHHRRAQGLPALSVDWGVWAGTGMAMRSRWADAQGQMKEGTGSFTPRQGLEALGRLLQVETTQVAVMSVDWRQLRRLSPAGASAPLVAHLVPAAEPASAPGEKARMLRRLEEAPPEERLELLTAHVRELVTRVLGLRASHVLAPDQGFFDIGMDSLMAVDLKNRLEASLGHPLATAAIFNYPNVDALSGYLAKQVLALEPAAPPPPPAEPATPEAPAVDEVRNLSEQEMEAFISDELQKLLG